MTALTQQQFDALTALKCTVGYNRYGAYCVPLSSRHRPAATMILKGEIYEPNTIEFMRAHCATGDIVHAGTYFGDFLPGLSQACRGKIWAFEPNLENYRCARITMLLNDLNNVELCRAGLGSARETRALLTADPDGLARGGSSTFVTGPAMPEGRIEMVPMVTIDEAVPPDRPVSIIQLDLEGFELPALEGALKTIVRCRPVILLEVLADSNLFSDEWFTNNVLKPGYRMTGTIHGNAVFFPS
jgi:FkbM family methyltransferase